MRKQFALIIGSMLVITLTGCKTENPVAAADTSDSSLAKTIAITALIADPDVVPFGQNSVIICKTTVGGDSTYNTQLNYEWSATGAYGYLNPQESFCLFYSPSCHYGFAQVMVTVSDGLGNSVSDTVDINPIIQ